jgi:DHA2 family multidrug resistance protein-like MFS transporter
MDVAANECTWNGLAMPRRLWAILAVTFGVSLSVLDGTIVNVALPTMARELQISPADSIWAVNAYQLATIVSLLTFSTLGDIWGYRNIYVVGLSLFTVASLGCAYADTLVTLIVMRALQGVGCSAVVSVNTSLIRTIYPRKQLGRGMGINATVVAIMSVAGPSVAAAVLSMTSWHWLFFINIPIGVVAIMLSLKFLPHNPMKTRAHFDWRDGMLNGLMFGLLIASIEGYSHGIELKIALGVLLLSLLIGYVFIRGQLKKPFPILPFDLLRIPIFSLSLCTSVCSYMAQMLAMVALPFFLQHNLGYGEIQTGLLLTAWPAIIVVVAPLAGWLVERVHAGILGGMGLALLSVGLFSLVLLPAHPTAGAIVCRFMLCGAGFGLFQSPNNSILIASAPPQRSGSASGMLATARLLGQTTGAAFVALLFHLSPNRGTHYAFCVAACLALLGAIASSTRISLALPEVLRHK